MRKEESSGMKEVKEKLETRLLYSGVVVATIKSVITGPKTVSSNLKNRASISRPISFTGYRVSRLNLSWMMSYELTGRTHFM